MPPIDRREDVNPKQGIREYGNVEFADPVNKKYPLNTEKHIRTAWSYIHHDENAAKYARDELKTIKDRIKRAARKHDIEIDLDKSK